jgi:hypothetical protein
LRLRAAASDRLSFQRDSHAERRITLDRLLDAVTQYYAAIAAEERYKVTYVNALIDFEEFEGTLLEHAGIRIRDYATASNGSAPPTDAPGRTPDPVMSKLDEKRRPVDPVGDLGATVGTGNDTRVANPAPSVPGSSGVANRDDPSGPAMQPVAVPPTTPVASATTTSAENRATDLKHAADDTARTGDGTDYSFDVTIGPAATAFRIRGSITVTSVRKSSEASVKSAVAPE